MGKTEKMKSRIPWEKWLPLFLIVITWALFSSPYGGKGKIPFPSTYLVTFFTPWSQTHGMPVKNNAMPDVITQIFPWKRLTISSWKEGVAPLWNPYSFSGTPHLGNYQSAIFSPMNVIFFLLPEVHAWSVMILLQPLLAGMFMFLFLRRIDLSYEGAALGSIAFMFSGFLVVWMAYGTLGYAILTLPLVLYGLESWRRTGNMRFASLSAIGIAWSFLSGHFQMSLYVLLAASVYVISLPDPTRNGMMQRIYRLTPLILGVGIAAVQILPSFESYRESVRSSLFQRGEIIPWKYVTTLFSPDYFGNPVTRNDWFGHYAEWSSYVGVVPLFLSIFAISAVRKSIYTRFFFIMAIWSMLLAFETPLSELLFRLHIPVLSTSAASRIIVLFSFSLSVLSAIGFDVLLNNWRKQDWKSAVRPVVIMVVLCIIFWVVTLLQILTPSEKVLIAIRNSVLPTGILLASIGIIVGGFLVPEKIKKSLLYLILIVSACDSYRFASKWMPFDAPEYLYPPTPVISKLQELTKSSHGRVFGNLGGEAGVSFSLPLIEGYDAVYQHRYGRLISSVNTGVVGNIDRSVVVYPKRGEMNEFMLELLGVSYYMHKKSDGQFPWAYPFWEYPHYSLVWEDPNFAIYQNTKALPRVFLASAYRLANTEQEQLRELYDPTFTPGETLILEEKPQVEPQTGSGRARISSYQTSRVTITTDATVPKLLFLSDVYDDGWHVSVDGVTTKLLRANFDFRAVSLPPGRHTVTMWYFPMSYMLGMVISFGSLVAVILGMIQKHTHENRVL